MNKSEITNLIKELLEKTNITIYDIILSEETPQNIMVKIELGEPHFFVNRDGEGLLALNHIVRKIIDSRNTPTDPTHNVVNTRSNILIDINGFQQKRIEGIRAIAHMMAERARYFKSNIEVDPMSSFERRIVHEFLSDEVDLRTESTGLGPSRRVVIKYTGEL